MGNFMMRASASSLDLLEQIYNGALANRPACCMHAQVVCMHSSGACFPNEGLTCADVVEQKQTTWPCLLQERM